MKFTPEQISQLEKILRVVMADYMDCAEDKIEEMVKHAVQDKFSRDCRDEVVEAVKEKIREQMTIWVDVKFKKPDGDAGH